MKQTNWNQNLYVKRVCVFIMCAFFVDEIDPELDEEEVSDEEDEESDSLHGVNGM